MTVVQLKKNAAQNLVFNNLLGDVFSPVPSIYGQELKNRVSVNIKETETAFVLELIAPGLEKDNFNLNLEKNILTISAEIKNDNKTEGVKTIRTEYNFVSFKRSFTLDDSLDAEKIEARYLNGILTVSIAKKVEMQPAKKQITIN